MGAAMYSASAGMPAAAYSGTFLCCTDYDHNKSQSKRNKRGTHSLAQVDMKVKIYIDRLEKTVE